MLNGYHALQNWFSPNKKFAKRVFGSSTNIIGKEQSFFKLFHYLRISFDSIKSFTDPIKVFKCDHTNALEMYEFVK